MESTWDSQYKTGVREECVRHQCVSGKSSLVSRGGVVARGCPFHGSKPHTIEVYFGLPFRLMMASADEPRMMMMMRQQHDDDVMMIRRAGRAACPTQCLLIGAFKQIDLQNNSVWPR